MIGWSKYRLGLPGALLHYGLTWAVGIPTVFQTPVTVPMHNPKQWQAMPAVRAVQGDCERVYYYTDTLSLVYLILETSNMGRICGKKTSQLSLSETSSWTNRLTPNKAMLPVCHLLGTRPTSIKLKNKTFKRYKQNSKQGHIFPSWCWIQSMD